MIHRVSDILNSNVIRLRMANTPIPAIEQCFPSTCLCAMPDKHLRLLQEASRAKGFGLGPPREAFKGIVPFPATFSAGSQALLPVYSIQESQTKLTGLELLLLAVNHQNGNEKSDSSDDVPSIAARLIACLYVLTMSPKVADYRVQKGVSSIAQRQLSSLLIEYPVLMHPELRIWTGGFFLDQGQQVGRPLVSVANAIALAKYARLPMASDGIDSSRLIDYANNSCTRIGLTVQTPALLSTQRSSKATPFGMAFGMTTIRPGLIASLHELSILTKVSNSRREALAKRNPWNCNDPTSSTPGLFSHLGRQSALQTESDSEIETEKKQRELRSDHLSYRKHLAGLHESLTAFSYLKDDTAYFLSETFTKIYAVSFVAACGVGGKHVFGRVSDVNNGDMIMETRTPDPAFLSAFRDLRLSESVDLVETLKIEVINRIFFDENFIEFPSVSVSKWTHLITHGLVSAGVVKDLAGAGEWLLDRMRKDDLPKASLESASAFIQALDVYGVSLDTKVLDTDTESLSSSNERANPSNPIRSIWIQVARIHEVQKMMSNVIQMSGAKQDVAGKSGSVETPKRRRMGI